MLPRRRALTGWGGTAASVADVLELPTHEVPSALHAVGPRGALARGLGRSYGDAAQNGGGLVVRPLATAYEARIDAERGTITCPAGVSIDDLLRLIVPRGWFVPVTPGTRFVTIGGAIASDVHGKNHHADGSFGNHVESLTLLLADGSQVVVGPDRDPALFWATVGGMGLTGVILDATFRMLPVATSRMTVDTLRLADLDALMAEMDANDHRYRYSVAWVDIMAKGARLGRSVLTRGDHAAPEQLEGRAAADPLAYDARMLASLPPVVPAPGLINKLSVAAFNELWFRKAPARRDGEVQSIAGFFHPLDGVGEWNRVYGRGGLVQYQFVVPFGEEAAMRRVIERLAGVGAASFLTVLKRFGPGNPAPLSFPCEGWTLALDVPTTTRGLGPLLHELDRSVLDAGGRLYLTKDSMTSPDVIRRSYPRLGEWQDVQRRVDPHGVWQSDLSRRLALTSAAGANGGGTA